jgi:hypothetical protein
MSKIILTLTADELSEVARCADTKRGIMAKVPKALLAKLIVDHNRALKYIGREFIEGY